MASVASCDKWKCEVCFVGNDGSDVVCACCETARPGTDTKSTVFGAAAFAATSSFVIPTLSTTDSSTHTTSTPIKFGFGGVDAPSVSTRVTDTHTNTHSNAFTHTHQEDGSNDNTDVDGDAKSDDEIETKVLGLDEKVNILFKPKQTSGNKVAVGTLYMWGTGECDQLAFGDRELNDSSSCEYPKEVSLRNFEQKPRILPQFISISCGALHTVGLTYDGKLWSWGCNDDFALGRLTADETAEQSFDGNVDEVAEDEDVHSSERFPDLVCNLPKQSVCKVSCGDNHTACLTSNGDCYIWGSYKDSGGYIGFPDYSSKTGSLESNKCGMPTQVPLPNRCYQLRCGENHTVVLTNQNEMYVWGSGEFGQLALKPMDDLADKTPWLYPVHRSVEDLGVEEYGYITKVYTGRATTFFIMSEGRVFGCGRNSRSEVGVDSDESVVWKPQELIEFRDLPVRHITGGQYFSCAILADGSLYTWGHEGHVGQGLTQDVRTPLQVMGIENITKVYTGGDAGYCVTQNGHCYAWGEGQMYQLGNGTDDCEPVLRPSLINPKNFGKKFVLGVAAGSQHAAALVWSGKYGTLPSFDRFVMAPVNKRRREFEDNARRQKRRRNETGELSPPTETVSPPAKKAHRRKLDDSKILKMDDAKEVVPEKSKRGTTAKADKRIDESSDEHITKTRTKRGRSESSRSVSKPPVKSRAKQVPTGKSEEKVKKHDDKEKKQEEKEKKQEKEKRQEEKEKRQEEKEKKLEKEKKQEEKEKKQQEKEKESRRHKDKDTYTPTHTHTHTHTHITSSLNNKNEKEKKETRSENSKTSKRHDSVPPKTDGRKKSSKK